MNFSERLRLLRKRKRLTQLQLAEKLGFGYDTITKYERGIVDPRMFHLCCMADFFEVTTDYLIGRSDEPINKLEVPKCL